MHPKDADGMANSVDPDQTAPWSGSTLFAQTYQSENVGSLQYPSDITWAMTWQNQQNECAPCEDSDQPGHPPSLIRVFPVHMKKAWVLSYPLSAQRRLWSDWADAQADLNLHWAHSHFVGFIVSWLTYINSKGSCESVNPQCHQDLHCYHTQWNWRKPDKHPYPWPFRMVVHVHMSCSMTKPTKWHVRPAKRLIRDFSVHLKKVWVLSYPYWKAHSEDSDQTGRMPRLIWVFAGRTGHFVGFVALWLKFCRLAVQCLGPVSYSTCSIETAEINLRAITC